MHPHRTLEKGKECDLITKCFVDFTRWVEHDPIEILESVKMCISKAIDKANVDGYNFDNGLKAIGVTDKRESTNFWSESTGVPLYNVIVWMDVRSTSIC
ncbi:glycerol kinase, partial [Tanacetum coccineum]